MEEARVIHRASAPGSVEETKERSQLLYTNVVAIFDQLALCDLGHKYIKLDMNSLNCSDAVDEQILTDTVPLFTTTNSMSEYLNNRFQGIDNNLIKINGRSLIFTGLAALNAQRVVVDRVEYLFLTTRT